LAEIVVSERPELSKVGAGPVKSRSNAVCRSCSV